MSAGRSQFTLRPYRAGDFPHLPSPSGATVSLSTTGLAEALRQVVRAASSEDTRPVLTGVLMAAEAEGMRLVATDSYRLAVKDLPGAKESWRRVKRSWSRRGLSVSSNGCWAMKRTPSNSILAPMTSALPWDM